MPDQFELAVRDFNLYCAGDKHSRSCFSLKWLYFHNIAIFDLSHRLTVFDAFIDYFMGKYAFHWFSGSESGSESDSSVTDKFLGTIFC